MQIASVKPELVRLHSDCLVLTNLKNPSLWNVAGLTKGQVCCIQLCSPWFKRIKWFFLLFHRSSRFFSRAMKCLSHQRSKFLWLCLNFGDYVCIYIGRKFFFGIQCEQERARCHIWSNPGSSSSNSCLHKNQGVRVRLRVCECECVCVCVCVFGITHMNA